MTTEETGQICAFDKLFKRNVPHILESIFFSLDFNSLVACGEVCKNWKDLMDSDSYRDKLLEKRIKERQERQLFKSCGSEDIAEVKKLLSMGVDPNCTRQDDGGAFCNGDTPLCLAAKNYRNTVFLYNPGNTHRPWLKHTLDTRYHVINLLLNAGANPNKIDTSGYTPLYWSVRNNNRYVVQLLLNGGADANKTDNSGATALHVSAGQGNDDVVKMLLNKGADTNATDEWGETPLHWSVRHPHKEVVRILCDGGADPNMTDRWGETPLLLSVGKGHDDVVKLLLEAGADANKAGAYGGETPLIKLLLNETHEAICDLSPFCRPKNCPELVKVTKLLLNAGADPSLANDDGVAPLLLASGEGNILVVQALLNAGAEPDRVNNMGETSLLHAAKYGHIAVVQNSFMLKLTLIREMKMENLPCFLLLSLAILM